MVLNETTVSRTLRTYKHNSSGLYMNPKPELYELLGVVLAARVLRPPWAVEVKAHDLHLGS